MGHELMNKSKAKAKLLPFDAARYLISDAAIAEYMAAVLETDDPGLLLIALSDILQAERHGASR
jgi:DNA-binding phage protein